MSGLSRSPSLQTSSFKATPHGHIPFNEKTIENDINIIKVGELKPDAPGHNFFLAVRLLVISDFSGRETLLGGLVATIQLLSSLFLNFRLHSMDAVEHYPDIVSHLVELGFPKAAAVAFYCFKMRNKQILNQGPNLTATSTMLGKS